MEVFRISKEIYANTLVASGAANRWNLQGQQVIYTGSSRALSTLEFIVHSNSIIRTINYKVMVISIADNDVLITNVLSNQLPTNWKTTAAYPILQNIGNHWYTSHKSLILRVPSAVIQQEYNYIINTVHPDFNKYVKLIRSENYFFDERLF